jgi:AcrR family transcriptional regulator
MTRTYTLKRRAEQQAQTRRRIVEAAVELHGSVGPALTTVSMVAERAGVQRHTFYAHFPDDRSLWLACSGLVAERDPLPDAEPWRTIEDSRERLRIGLRAVYGWYERNADLTACVLRDAEYHALTREIVELRFGTPAAAYREVLGAKLNARQRAMLRLALSFFTWRTLAREHGLKQGAAVAAMVQAIDSASESLKAER